MEQHNRVLTVEAFLNIQQGNGRALPKFGEWDVNDPASAEGFTVIFNKAIDEKKTTSTISRRSDPVFKNENYRPPQYSSKVNLNTNITHPFQYVFEYPSNKL